MFIWTSNYFNWFLFVLSSILLLLPLHPSFFWPGIFQKHICWVCNLNWLLQMLTLTEQLQREAETWDVNSFLSPSQIPLHPSDLAMNEKPHLQHLDPPCYNTGYSSWKWVCPLISVHMQAKVGLPLEYTTQGNPVRSPSLLGSFERSLCSHSIKRTSHTGASISVPVLTSHG